MPFSSIQVTPGVNTIATPTLNAAGISASNLIRFRGGLPEKMGGWQRFIPGSMGSITKCLHPWVDLRNNIWLAAGNVQSLIVMVNSATQNITPQSLTSSPAMNISTTIGSGVVTIVDTNISNLTAYDAVYFNTPITVGGIILSGLYNVSAGGSGTSYSIATGQIATATVASGGTVPSLTTAANTSTVTVTFANHGLTAGKYFYFPIPTIVDIVTIFGSYPVTVTGANTFTISANTAANAIATVSMNSSLPQYLYYISNGPASTVSYGALGPIGQFAIGQGYALTATVVGQVGVPITASDWTMDNWGETLLACPAGGPVFYWSPTTGFSNAVPVGTGPSQNAGIFVAMPQQILVAWGSAKTLLPGNCDSSTDPLIVRWTNQNDFTNWTLSYTSLAGSFHLGTGSKIVGCIQGAHNAFVITDIDIYSMGYLGYPLVFGFNQIGTGCGLVGPHAVITMRGVVYWMSNSNFYYTSGASSVQSIPCSVWDAVFQNLNLDDGNKVVAGANEDFDEIIFFYPTLDNDNEENNNYAKLNVVTGVWDIGVMPRSAWTGRSALGPAIGADPTTTLLQQHETGYSADGAQMDSYFETGYFAYGDGENFAVIDHFEPDMKWQTNAGLATTPSASVLVTLTTTDYPSGGSPMTTGQLTMTSTTPYLTPRVRGRQAKWKIETNDTTSWWRIGNVRYRYGVDGRR
jgi:hypothetical protein